MEVIDSLCGSKEVSIFFYPNLLSEGLFDLVFIKKKKNDKL